MRLPIRVVFTSAAQHRHSWFPRWLISKMDAVIATTAKAAALVPNTSAVIPHGIDLDQFHPPADKLLAWQESGLPGKFGIGNFGRVRPNKGTDVFVESMIASLPAFPHATAVVTGLAAPEHQAFQANLKLRIANAGLSERIIFLGELPFAEVKSWMQRCLVAVACPRYEPFGLTPFEAAACGCALVCSRTGAFEELVLEGENGLLVAPGSVDDLQQAITRMLGNLNATASMGEAARESVVARFAVSREADQIADVYKRIWNG